MKLVTQTQLAACRYNDEKAIKMICEAGFDGIDYSMFSMKDHDDHPLNTSSYKSYAKHLKDIASSYGVTFEQSHAPFPTAKAKDEEYNEMILPKIKRSIETAAILDAKIIVVHPVYYKHDKYRRNMEMYLSLEPIARYYGVKIAVENMWGRGFKDKIIPNVCSDAKEFNDYVDSLNPDVFTACLDLGHCGLVGEKAENMIRAMGRDRLGCLHIHDNDGVSDEHTLPYTGGMNWDEILRALGEIDYKGNFTYEADNFLLPLPKEVLPDAFKFMAALGKNMMNQIDGYRK